MGGRVDRGSAMPAVVIAAAPPERIPVFLRAGAEVPIRA
jgi:alpha-glucosidase (family GH31 glycosyl hydrolase)